jgi:hypothetical protein
MTDRIDANVTLNVTVHDPQALRKAAWEHADFRRRAGGVEADLLTLLDDRMSPPGASIEDSSAELFRLESVL